MSYIIHTNIQLQIINIKKGLSFFLSYKINSLGLQLLNILLGFFIATALSTIPAQTGDWGVVAAGIIVTNQEIISKIIYQNNKSIDNEKTYFLNFFLKYCNSVKLGVIYGLFVDAFKLGS